MNRRMPSPHEQANLLLDWLYLETSPAQTERLSAHLDRSATGCVGRADEVRRLARLENLGEVYKILGN